MYGSKRKSKQISDYPFVVSGIYMPILIKCTKKSFRK